MHWNMYDTSTPLLFLYIQNDFNLCSDHILDEGEDSGNDETGSISEHEQDESDNEEGMYDTGSI